MTGGLFHVICRFFDKNSFLDVEGARPRYLESLSTALSRSDARLLAYCLMSTHVHLVLQLGRRPLGSFMRTVNAPWAMWLNRVTGRIGTTLADRPTSVLCDSEMYILELVRYVHNNPVRAGLVDRASASSWSSQRAYLGLDEPPDWLDIEPVLLRFDDDVEAARKGFAEFVDDGRLQPRNPELAGELSREALRKLRNLVNGTVELSYPVLGPDEFVRTAFGEQVVAVEDQRQFADVSIGARDVLIAVCDELDLDAGIVLSRVRSRPVTRVRRLVAWVWCERLGRTQMTIADLFGIRPSAVTMMLNRMRSNGEAARERDLLERILRRLRRRLIQLLEEQSTDRNLDGGQVLLLQRLRAIDERLFGPRIYNSGKSDT